MRLAQAARTLSITTEDIIDFLEIRGIVIEKDSNTKLEEEAIKLLYQHFEIEEEDATEARTPKEEEPPLPALELLIAPLPADPTVIISDELGEEIYFLQYPPPAPPQAPPGAELLEDDDEGEESKDELVIKAPKVELKGLNVVGKIDLPEPKPKPEKEQKDEPKAKKTHSKPRPKKSTKRKGKRELSPAEIRKREEQREARKQKRIEKEKKEKREQFYKDKILVPKQLEQKRKSKKKKKIVKEINPVQKPKPKTILGKFWRWLNT